jgi:hypothetical protein
MADKPQTTHEPTQALPTEEAAAFKNMCHWFNSWLEKPLSDRERTLLDEMLWYQQNMEDIHERY